MNDFELGDYFKDVVYLVTAPRNISRIGQPSEKTAPARGLRRPRECNGKAMMFFCHGKRGHSECRCWSGLFPLKVVTRDCTDPNNVMGGGDVLVPRRLGVCRAWWLVGAVRGG